MKDSHVELIDPKEKIPVEWGGYGGYVGPRGAATVMELYVNALAAYEQSNELNSAVWKVLRSSLSGKGPPRQLRIGGRRIPCETLGGAAHWWFVSVNAQGVAALLEPIAKGVTRMAESERRRDMRRTVREGDTVIVRDDNGIIVVETATEWGKARQQVKALPDGWSVEYKKSELREG